MGLYTKEYFILDTLKRWRKALKQEAGWRVSVDWKKVAFDGIGVKTHPLNKRWWHYVLWWRKPVCNFSLNWWVDFEAVFVKELQAEFAKAYAGLGMIDSRKKADALNAEAVCVCHQCRPKTKS